MFNSNITTVERVIELIENHKSVVAPHNEYYQLAHDHIIKLIRRKEVYPDLDNIYIEGYRLKDLVIIAERLRKDKLKPQVVMAANEAFLDGYKAAREEFNKALEESVNRIIEEGL